MSASTLSFYSILELNRAVRANPPRGGDAKPPVLGPIGTRDSGVAGFDAKCGLRGAAVRPLFSYRYAIAGALKGFYLLARRLHMSIEWRWGLLGRVLGLLTITAVLAGCRDSGT